MRPKAKQRLDKTRSRCVIKVVRDVKGKLGFPWSDLTILLAIGYWQTKSQGLDLTTTNLLPIGYWLIINIITYTIIAVGTVNSIIPIC